MRRRLLLLSGGVGGARRSTSAVAALALADRHTGTTGTAPDHRRRYGLRSLYVANPTPGPQRHQCEQYQRQTVRHYLDWDWEYESKSGKKPNESDSTTPKTKADTKESQKTPTPPGPRVGIVGGGADADFIVETHFYTAVQRAVDQCQKVKYGGERRRIAFDVKGYNIGRFGTIELVTVLFEPPVVQQSPFLFVVDVAPLRPDEANNTAKTIARDKRIRALKRLLQISSDLIKVTHDCQMPADALRHVLNIRVDNLMDTMCFNKILDKVDEPVTLQKALANVKFKLVLDTSEFNRIPGFWAARPLTDEMIHLCAADVEQLLTLVDKQMKRMRRPVKTRYSKTKSARYSNSVRDLETVFLQEQDGDHHLDPAHLTKYNQLLQKYFKAVPAVPVSSDAPFSGEWAVYYRTDDQLEIVRRALGYHQKKGYGLWDFAGPAESEYTKQMKLKKKVKKKSTRGSHQTSSRSES